MPDLFPPLSITPGAHLLIDPIGGAPQRQLTQGDQVAFAEEVFDCPFGIFTDIDFAFFQSLAQIVRRQIHQHHFISAVEERIGHGFAHPDTGYAAHHIIQAFQMLHVNRGHHVDPGVQQFFNILPALGMTGSAHVAVRQFINQDNRRMARQRGVQIKFLLPSEAAFR